MTINAKYFNDIVSEIIDGRKVKTAINFFISKIPEEGAEIEGSGSVDIILRTKEEFDISSDELNKFLRASRVIPYSIHYVKFIVAKNFLRRLFRFKDQYCHRITLFFISKEQEQLLNSVNDSAKKIASILRGEKSASDCTEN